MSHRQPMANRPSLLPTLMLLVSLIITVIPVVTSAQSATPGPASLQPLTASAANALDREGRLFTDYLIDVVVDFDLNLLTGQATIAYLNTTGTTVEEIAFRLYPNAPYYGSGSLTIAEVSVDGTAATSVLSSLDTAMTIPLAQPLQPFETAVVDMQFEVSIPENSTGSFGIFSDDSERGTWILSDWYPIVAGWDPESGWRLDPPTSWGDPTFSETATYAVTFDRPEDLTIAATGVSSTASGAIGRTRERFVTGPVRDFAAVLDDDFVTDTVESGGLTINVLASADSVSPDVRRDALELADEVMMTFGDVGGDYPYTEIDLVSTELAGALGVSWSGIVFLDAVTLEESGGFSETIRFLIAHELLHQWWGGVIGANSNDHGFMNESLANYLAVLLIEEIDGPVAAQPLFERFVVAPYMQMLTTTGDGVVDTPISATTDPLDYGRLVYGKGALGLMAIREVVGPEAFAAALRTYGETFAFGIAYPDDLLAAFEMASGQDLDPLWTFWFESAETTVADVEALIS